MSHYGLEPNECKEHGRRHEDKVCPFCMIVILKEDIATLQENVAEWQRIAEWPDGSRIEAERKRAEKAEAKNAVTIMLKGTEIYKQNAKLREALEKIWTGDTFEATGKFSKETTVKIAADALKEDNNP